MLTVSAVASGQLAVTFGDPTYPTGLRVADGDPDDGVEVGVGG